MSNNSSQPVTNHSKEQPRDTQATEQSVQSHPRRKPRRPRRRGVPDDQDDQDETDNAQGPPQGASQNKPQSAAGKRNQPKLDRTDPRFIPRGMFFQHDDRAGVKNAVAAPPVAPPSEEKKMRPDRKPRSQQKFPDEPKWQHDRFQPEPASESSPRNSSGSRGARGRGRGRGSGRRGRGAAPTDNTQASADSSVPVIQIAIDPHQLAPSAPAPPAVAPAAPSSRGRRRGGRGRRRGSASNQDAPAHDAAGNEHSQPPSTAASSGRGSRRRERRWDQSEASASTGAPNSTATQPPSVSSNVQSKPSSQPSTNHSSSIKSSAPRPYTSSAVPSVALVLGEDIPPHNFSAVSQQQPQQRRPPLTGHRAQRPSRPGAPNQSNSTNGASTSPSSSPVGSSTNLNPNAKEFVSHSSPGPMHSSPVMDPTMAQFFQPIGPHVASPPHAAVPTFLYGPYGYVQASPPPLSISPVPFPGYDGGLAMVDVGMQGMSMDPNYPQPPYLAYPQDPYGYAGTVSPPPVSMMPMMPQPYGMSQQMYMMGSDDGMNPGLSYMGQVEQLSPTAQMGYPQPMPGPVVPTPSPPMLTGQPYNPAPAPPAASGRPDSRVQPLPAAVAGRKKPPRFVDAE